MSSFNKLAKLICQKEGLKKQVDIAQVKEILKILVTDEQCSTLYVQLSLQRSLKLMEKEIKEQYAACKQKTVSKNKIYIVGAGGCGGGGGGGGGGPIRGVRIRTTKQK